MPDGRQLAPRGIPARFSESAASFSRPTDDIMILKYTIGNLEPGDFYAKLRGGVVLLDKAERMKMTDMLQKMGLDVVGARKALDCNNLQHCIRCHQNYWERDNWLTSCQPRHAEPRPVLTKNGHHVGNEYTCCRKTYAVNVVLPAVCLNRHTTRPEFGFDDGIQRNCC
ncbi:hypothetical protein OE88DRAFT_1504026 [Heliocybe sulcata]|uniref:Uncharacterized protein n=1 Tax=Heliocybe sulcata TaxID=5364 RepID=A0A5C3N4Q5_9AGAM|nr:hypothetical protein OE88DRAFT_1504026 [Heliocybe sulcata]